MQISERASEGFLLAATVARDRGAIRAEPGLAATNRDAWLAASRRFARLDRAERDRAVATIAAGPRLVEAHLADGHPRARCLLATRVPATLGRALLARGPLPRPGYAADPALLQLLYRCAHANAGAPPTTHPVEAP